MLAQCNMTHWYSAYLYSSAAPSFFRAGSQTPCELHVIWILELTQCWLLPPPLHMTVFRPGTHSQTLHFWRKSETSPYATQKNLVYTKVFNGAMEQQEKNIVTDFLYRKPVMKCIHSLPLLTFFWMSYLPEFQVDTLVDLEQVGRSGSLTSLGPVLGKQWHRLW